MEPIQYIFGETDFLDFKIKVTPSVLIPRPETEELVHWIIEKRIPNNSRILDVGTGSGCIALALKKRLKNCNVFGVDISAEALEVARKNGKINKLHVDFFQADILKWEQIQWEKFDVIISNPPYVRLSEKLEMNNNVLLYEPEKALFVTNEDPLVFYRTIAAFANKYLNEDGKLYFEINEYLAFEMKNLMLGMGFNNVEIKKDINGKNRMIYCEK